MTEDVDFYVELAREAEGPIVELAVGTGRIADPDRRAHREARDRDRPRRLRCSRSHASMPPRRASSSSCTRRDMRDLDYEAGDRSGHLPVPGASASADLGRSATRVRARRPSASAGWALRVERIRLRPSVRRRAWTGSGKTSRGDICTEYAAGRQPRRHHARGRPRALALVGRRAPSGKGSSTSPGSRPRRSTAGSTAGRSTTRAASSSGSHASPADGAVRRDRRVLRPVEPLGDRGRRLLRRGGARVRRPGRGAGGRDGPRSRCPSPGRAST